MIMIIVLVVCFVAMAFMLLGDGSAPAYNDALDGDLLSPGFVQVRKTKKIDDILRSLDMGFMEYDIYKRMKGGVSLPIVEDADIGNATPFLIKEFIPQSF